jgi:hypothetical protein
LNMTNNFDFLLIAGETNFTHATQDHGHGAPKLQRRTVGRGPTDYDTVHSILPPTSMPMPPSHSHLYDPRG